MPAPATVDDFLDVVRKSNQIDNARLDLFLQQHGDAVPADPRKLAALLLREGVITSFQAEQFLLGKHKGFLLGGYRILERLGSGGTGAVYLAEHQVMKRRVALKILPAHYASDPAVLERFRREAQAAAALDHPNIVRAYDFRHEGQLYFLVMEYVNGPNLQEVVQRQGAMPIALVCDYIRQAAIGLQHAHDAGLVHRDIKPANLLVDASGTVKVLDLGLARFAPEGQESVTKQFDENMVMGTADYLAPEQALNLHDVDSRADIYSLGATFYALLAGEPPFHEGTVTQKLLWHQMRSPKPLRDRRPDVPEDLAKLVSAMMAKAPGDRVQTAAEVAVLVEPWCPGSPRSEGASSSERTTVNGKTSPNFRSSTGSGPLGRTTIIPPEDAVSPEPPRPRSRRSLEGPTEKIRIVKDASATRILSVAMLVAVMGGILLLVGGVIAFLIWGPQPTPEPIHTPTHDHIPLVRPPVVFPADDPTRLWRGGPIPRLPDRIGEVGRLTDGPRGSNHVTFSPDGKRVAAAGADKNIRVWDILRGTLTVKLINHQAAVTDVAFPRKTRELLSASRDGTTRLWNLGKRQEARPLPNQGKPVWSAVFSPDEQKILTGCEDGVVRLFEVKTAKRLHEMTGHTGAVHGVAYRPPGKNKALNQALSASWDKTVRLWNLDDGKEVKQFKGHTGRVNAVAITSGGEQAVTAGGDGVRLWQIDSGNHLHAFTGNFGEVLAVAVSPDGRRALSAGRDSRVYLWDLRAKRMQQMFTGHTRPVTGVAFSPDGRHFVSCSEDATIRFWGLPPVQGAGK